MLPLERDRCEVKITGREHDCLLGLCSQHLARLVLVNLSASASVLGAIPTYPTTYTQHDTSSGVGVIRRVL